MKTLNQKLKSIHKSFANWFNTSGLLYLQALVAYPELGEYLNTHDLAWVLIIGNIIIRVLKTNKAIEDK